VRLFGSDGAAIASSVSGAVCPALGVNGTRAPPRFGLQIWLTVPLDAASPAWLRAIAARPANTWRKTLPRVGALAGAPAINFRFVLPIADRGLVRLMTVEGERVLRLPFRVSAASVLDRPGARYHPRNPSP